MTYAEAKLKRRHIARWREFDAWVSTTKPDCGQAYARLHQIWPEHSDEKREFLDHATPDEKYVYFH